VGKVNDMKLFITGISGRLGLNMALQARERFQISGCYYAHPVALDGFQPLLLDATSFGPLSQVLGQVRPNVIVHTAGLTNVDECEADPITAYRLNVETAQHVARVARALGAQLVHISTDHLFDGTKPWQTEEDSPTPLNVYAKTKWQAEQAVREACPDALVIRTNFFGWGTSVRTSFSDWILHYLENSRDLTMFSDVFFTPILINDLVEFILDLVAHQAKGIFHVAGGERLSKYSFALQIAEQFGYQTDRIRAISVEDFPFQARRPKDMSLSSGKVESCLQVRMPSVAEGLERLRHLRERGWQQTLEQALQGRSFPSEFSTR
jgi:dTDP-4-dehydrorhamnose reductase